jgi:SAM-dependent methyltransferase
MRKAEVHDFYEKRARFELAKRANVESKRKEKNKKLDIILRILADEKADRILELGCGRGGYLRNVSNRLNARFVVGVDFSKASLLGSEVLSPLIYNIEEGDLPLKDETFDLVLLLDVIEHLFDPDHVLDEILRVLKRGGYVIITTPNLASWYNRLCLLFGWQPFWTEVSTKFVIGNPLRERRASHESLMPSGHLRVFTPFALKRLLELHNFSIEIMSGYPPNEDFGLIFRLVEGLCRKRMASFIAVKARKR